MTTLRVRPVRLQLDLVQPLAVFAYLGLDGVAALGPIRLLCLELLDRSGLLAHLLGNSVDLRVERGAFFIQLGELAGQHQT